MKHYARWGGEEITSQRLEYFSLFHEPLTNDLPCRVPSSGGIQPGLCRVSFAGKFDT